MTWIRPQRTTRAVFATFGFDVLKSALGGGSVWCVPGITPE
jgi:hypothetical protein